jgi:hypothetical protein
MDFDKLDFEAIEKPVSLFSLSLKRTNNNKKILFYQDAGAEDSEDENTLRLKAMETQVN